MTDEGFHEIQLNGKQLVFMFMAATVVSVVVFLLGVMVGRGVRQPVTAVAAAAAETPVDPTASIQSSSANADRAPLSAQESLTYAERLEAPLPPPEDLKEPEPQPKVAPPAAAPKPEATRQPETATPTRPEPADTAAASASFREPAGNGWTVQVGAYPRPTAEAMARGLAAKGFTPFITPRTGGLFAVRVGKFTDRREAEATARRLEQDEQFKKPLWVTR